MILTALVQFMSTFNPGTLQTAANAGSSHVLVSGATAGKLSHCQGPAAAYPCPFIRLSFANASEAQIVEGIQRLGHILQQHASGVDGNSATAVHDV